MESRHFSHTSWESSAAVTQLGTAQRKNPRPRSPVRGRFDQFHVAQNHRQLASHPLWMNGRRAWIVTVGKDADTCGPGIRDGGFLCRSLRDLTTNVQTILAISDCIQQRTSGVLINEQGMSCSAICAKQKQSRNRSVPYF